ncbi:MAG: uncharacterized protein KVP18_001295 [Porospora cf. gigantea A]|uniref:uncharacterized protein n=1 Tax=Porospora cf. gigantea A TaxID=2853593 RepID=UPI00355AC78B|nr:MAG: hypothetical protein KVP18_001295 [Porospora cf. gigantea A]
MPAVWCSLLAPMASSMWICSAGLWEPLNPSILDVLLILVVASLAHAVGVLVSTLLVRVPPSVIGAFTVLASAASLTLFIARRWLDLLYVAVIIGVVTFSSGIVLSWLRAIATAELTPSKKTQYDVATVSAEILGIGLFFLLKGLAALRSPVCGFGVIYVTASSLNILSLLSLPKFQSTGQDRQICNDPSIPAASFCSHAAFWSVVLWLPAMVSNLYPSSDSSFTCGCILSAGLLAPLIWILLPRSTFRGRSQVAALISSVTLCSLTAIWLAVGPIAPAECTLPLVTTAWLFAVIMGVGPSLENHSSDDSQASIFDQAVARMGSVAGIIITPFVWRLGGLGGMLMQLSAISLVLLAVVMIPQPAAAVEKELLFAGMSTTPQTIHGNARLVRVFTKGLITGHGVSPAKNQGRNSLAFGDISEESSVLV